MTENSKNLTLNSWLVKATAQLAQAGIPSARLDCELLASYAVSKSRTWLHANPEHTLTNQQATKLQNLLKSRLGQEPLAYITNNKEFYGLDYYVDENVLVPRPETEDLVELVLDSTNSSPKPVLDLGCGSGVIGITLKLKRPKWHVTLSDISTGALKVAKKNAKKHGVYADLQFSATDMLPPNQHFEIVCANLPYVPKRFEKNKDISFEPKDSLFSGTDGLNHYRKFFSFLNLGASQPKILALEALDISHPRLIKLAQSHGYKLIESKNLALLFKLA